MKSGRSHYPSVIAGGFWLADIVTCRIPAGMHELLGSATVIVSVWYLLSRTERRRAPQPGERIVTEQEFAAVEQAMARAVAACYAGEPEGRRAPLRSVPGGP
jgi:hypothetical protein